MKIEPEWLTAGTGVVLLLGGIVAGWFRYGTRLSLVEQAAKTLKERVDRIEGGKRRDA